MNNARNVKELLDVSGYQLLARIIRKHRWTLDETLLSRLDDKRNDAIIIVMQRLHVDDLVGHVSKSGEWTR